MIKKFAFLLISLILISASVFAITADAGEDKITTNNVMVLLEGTCTDDAEVTECSWEVPAAECTTANPIINGIGTISATSSIEVTCTNIASPYITTLTGKNEIDPNASDNAIITVNENTAPTATEVAITPDLGNTSDELTCNYTYNDNESDAEGTSTFKWFKDTIVEAGETASTLDSSKTAKGEAWKCEVTPVAETGTSPGDLVQSAEVTIVNSDPVASLSGTPDSGVETVEVTFTGSCTDADDDIATCKIDFGDGSAEEDFTDSMTHTFTGADTYTVTLTATDDDAATDTSLEIVTVTAGNAPTVNNKEPSSDVNVLKPTISFDVNDSGSGVDISTLTLFIDGENKTAEANADTVYIGLNVEDDLGNGTGDVNWNFSVDTEAPNVTGIEIDEYYTNDKTPAITVNGLSSGTQIALSCNDSDWKAWQSYSSTVTNFNIYTGNYGCLDGSGGAVTVYLKAKDAVGNESASVNAGTNYDGSPPDRPTLDSAIGNDEEVELDWTSVEDNGSSGIEEYIVYRNGSEVARTVNTYYQVTNLTNGTSYDFRVAAVDSAGNTSDWSNELSETPVNDGSNNNDQDTSTPELFWELPGNNSTVSGMITLKVQAYDDQSSVSMVQFRVDNTPIDTDRTASGERYSIDWNSETVVDGTYTLKATAKNRSGTSNDTTVKTITITTNNGVTTLKIGTDSGDEADAQAALDAADDLKEEAVALIAEIQAFGIEISDEAAELLSDAVDLLDEAQTDFDDEEFEDTEEKAAEAEEKLNELIDMFAAEDYENPVRYVFNKEHLELMLQDLGFSPTLIEEAEAIAETFSASRKLSIKKITDGDSSVYRAIITITVKNDSDETREIKVIEIVPKEFAETASELVGDNYTVLVDDPVLEWTIELEAGEERELSYTLKTDFIADDAEELLISGVINKFSAPPILLEEETEVSKEQFSNQANAGLFALPNLVSLGSWGLLIIAIIAVALVAVNQLGKGEKNNPFDTAVNRSGLSSSFFDRIGSFGKKEEKQPGRKWSFKD